MKIIKTEYKIRYGKTSHKKYLCVKIYTYKYKTNYIV